MMSGCSKRQLLFRVQLPTARRDLLIGVNQVVMQCLAMVVIASLIGAQGLGSNLIIALNSAAHRNSESRSASASF